MTEWLSAIGTIGAFLAASYALVQAATAVRKAARPVLVLQWTADGWRIQNIGPGPALNPTVAVRRPPSSTWKQFVRIPGMGPQESLPVHWAQRDNEHQFAVWFGDVDGHRYMMEAKEERCFISSSSPKTEPKFQPSRPFWEMPPSDVVV